MSVYWCLFPLHKQTSYNTVVLPSWPAGHWMHRLPTSLWHKTNLSAFICVGGSPLKALLQDWHSPISTITFWQAAGGVTQHQLCTDVTWQAHRSVMSAITGDKLVAGRHLEKGSRIAHDAVVDCANFLILINSERQFRKIRWNWNTSMWSDKLNEWHCSH